MKRFLYAIFFLAPAVQAKQIILDIPDTDIKIVEHDVISAETWIKNAWAQKLASCKARLVNQEVTRSIADKETLPAGEQAILDKALARPDYLSRKDRDALEAGNPIGDLAK